MSNKVENKYLFNTPLEISLRLLVLLSKSKSTHFDLDRLVIFDYLILHGNDIDKTQKSLHPALPHRGKEVILKRKSIKKGIDILLSRGLISQIHSKDGIYYCSNQNTILFVELLESEYYMRLTENIEFINSKYSHVNTSTLTSLINENIHLLGSEFEYESLVRSNYEQ